MTNCKFILSQLYHNIFEVPDTGDTEQLTAWLGALFVSSLALLTLVIGRKKIRD